MKNLKKFIAVGTLVLAISSTSLIAYAASESTLPNETVNLTEFKAEILQEKKEALAEKVATGIITQDRADEIIAILEENQANCDGTGRSANSGKRLGLKFGGMNGNRQGNRQGKCGNF